MSYCIDLSHWQNPATLPWESWRGKVDVVIVRGCYGAAPDDRAKEHVRHARSIGASVGLYTFWRPSQPVEDQFSALVGAMHDCGMGAGDIVPAIDVEDDTYPHLTPLGLESSEPAHDLCERIVDSYGDCLVYITHRDFGRIGSPSWVTDRPLWVAEYANIRAPATPGGKACVLWQHRVGPVDLNGPGGEYPGNPQIDQSRVLAPIPRIPSPGISDEDRSRIGGLVAETEEQSAEGSLERKT